MSDKVDSDQKFEDFSEWYDRILLEAQIADDRYPVKGFTVYTGWGYSIAKRIYQMLESMLEETDHQPMQFPVVIPEDAFQKEEDHIEGFSAEVFWITHAGENELERRLVLRPTSETAIYPMFKLWIRSHADLPLRMHQTCNVYRYETKATRPLYRGREFLWNEGHTAHVDFDDAERQVEIAVEIYKKVYDSLGISYLLLKRPDFDKFAGAVYTLAFDTWNPDGKSSQIGTVHNLGENFAKAFDVTYEDDEGTHRHVSNTCYGMGFGRTLAATIAHHGDNNGLVLPPVVAPKQVVIVPILFRGREADVVVYSKEVEAELRGAGIRTVLDDDDRLRPGEKYYKWDMYGVPLRVEVGPREADTRTVTIVRRDNRAKSKASFDELVGSVRVLFEELFADISRRSRERLEGELVDASTLEELQKYMEERKMARVNWCGEPSCAFELKDQVSGEVRGTLWGGGDQPMGPCMVCGDEAKYIAYVSQTY